MTPNDALAICGVLAFAALCTIAVFVVVLLYIFPKRDSMVNDDDFEMSFSILKAIIASEIDLYDKNVFEHNRPITNANFENFYMDLSNRILKKVSPLLMRNLQKWMTEEAIVSYVSRTVQRYLTQFVGDPL